ncbi:MAG: hypothetical protein ACTTI4_09515 [Prevotella fusca]|uniref:hypothetical protein n=1 Tax=Prevotella fusca TaxID=589436 RepID=UPI003F9ED22E
MVLIFRFIVFSFLPPLGFFSVQYIILSLTSQLLETGLSERSNTALLVTHLIYFSINIYGITMIMLFGNIFKARKRLDSTTYKFLTIMTNKSYNRIRM